MSLNPEPAAPEERAELNLPPKTYADAAEEALTGPQPRAGGTDGTVEDSNRRLDSKVEGNRANGLTTPPEEDGPRLEGIGQDASPKSQTKGHRRKGSRGSFGSTARKLGEALEPEVFEKHTDGSGDALTSVRPPRALEKEPRTDLKRTNSLTAGRQAGAGWARSKIRWAPMNVPLQRRLQTLVVLMHTLSVASGLAIFFFLCAVPIFWPIVIPYLVYVLFSQAGTSGELSFRSERLRRLPVWSLFASYFPARLHRSVELEPTRKYLFGYHPHGIISHGAFAAFATEALGFSQLVPGITNALLTLDSNFRYPVYREYALRLGMASVSRESCENILTKGGRNGEGMGRAITIVIGGASESLDSRPGTIRLVLNKRRGFIKIALRTGADLVPVLAFGENDLYEQLDGEAHPWLHKFQMAAKGVMGFTVPFFHARGIFNYDVGLMPYRRPINIVVGRPIAVTQDKHAPPEKLEELHKLYKEELLRLWDEHKDTFAKNRQSDMEIVE